MVKEEDAFHKCVLSALHGYHGDWHVYCVVKDFECERKHFNGYAKMKKCSPHGAKQLCKKKQIL